MLIEAKVYDSVCKIKKTFMNTTATLPPHYIINIIPVNELVSFFCLHFHKQLTLAFICSTNMHITNKGNPTKLVSMFNDKNAHEKIYDFSKKK